MSQRQAITPGDDGKFSESRSALVTGAAQGVGKGIALELCRAGFSVAVNYCSDAHIAEKTVVEIESIGGKAFPVKADVRSSADVHEMFDSLATRFSRLDLLVNNAGTQTWAPLMELSETDWDRDIDTNLKGTFLCLQTAAKWMRQCGGGSIVNIGSGCNKVPFPRLVSYSASKGGIEMLTKVAAIELGPYRIRVNCVAPGAILIERTKQEDPQYESIWSSAAPIGRVGLPADVANAVLFLASDQASFITGQTIWVDGAAFTKPNWPYNLADEKSADGTPEQAGTPGSSSASQTRQQSTTRSRSR
jgi:NAD(P)-dependent dehydrogenase (short-subunit alcohol dehydrogenase family)